LQPRGKEWIEQRLQHRKRHRYQERERRRERAERRVDRLECVRGSGIAEDDAAHRLALQLLWKRRTWWHAQKREDAADRLGRGRNEVREERKEFGGTLDRPQHGPGDDGVHRMKAEHERGDYAEIAPAAAESPEQVRVIVFAGD